MSTVDKWLLPEGIDELLPEQATAAESLRRQLLDTYQSWGYELIRPPMVEFLDALKVGTGNDLALQTFTLTDQVSGRLLGLRADLTPQVARMDAHSLKREGAVRLCYCAPVLHSIARHLGTSRELDQIGIELFGSSSVNADVEVVELMLMSIKKAGAFKDETLVKLDLGNVEIYRAAAQLAGLNEEQESSLCDILQRKALPELKDFVSANIKQAVAKDLILNLPKLCGDVEVLEKAKVLFSKVEDEEVKQRLNLALSELNEVYSRVRAQIPSLECYFDLSELRGYDYHTGLVFAVYKQGFAQALAKGGRYDAIGESFGRSRPATGFSCDLRQLLRLLDTGVSHSQSAIFAPACDSKEESDSLRSAVAELRLSGEIVIQALGGDDDLQLKESCERCLVFDAGSWQVKKL
jgi:ATP phosphoribosyltransferase regulatory subunit